MSLKSIPLDKIVRNPDQPRKDFSDEAISELAASIAELGLLQPIGVRPITPEEAEAAGSPDAKYMIVFGETRYRAHLYMRDHGIKDRLSEPVEDIQAHIRRMDDNTMDIAAIVENLRRIDLKPLEEAAAYKRVVDKGMEPEALAKRLGCKQIFHVAQRLRLLELTDELKQLLGSGQLQLQWAQEIAKLPQALQTKVLRGIVSGDIKTGAQVAKAVETLMEGHSQQDIFGEAEPKTTDKDVATLNHMEAKIIRVADMIGAGWKDGECIVALKVSPDRVALMADKIGEIRKALTKMERMLRDAQAQGAMLMEAGADPVEIGDKDGEAEAA